MSSRSNVALLPITALNTPPKSDVVGVEILLVGEGGRLKILCLETSKLLFECRVFEDQVLHGISSYWALNDASNCHGKGSKLVCLIWGAYSCVILKLGVSTEASQARVDLVESFSPSFAADWILDGCFTPLEWSTELGSRVPEAVLVTAHNEMLALNCSEDGDLSHESSQLLPIIGKGPSTILYSAKCVLVDKETVLVASGTAFGEVILWQCKFELNSIDDSPATSCRKLLSLYGHEGSIFGVDIYVGSNQNRGNLRALLASCSDDRTVRLWDVSKVLEPGYTVDRLESATATHLTGFGANEGVGQQPSSSLAVGMGHLSRIWHVRIVKSGADHGQVLSFGEDSTVQLWEWKLKQNQTQKLEASTSLMQVASYEFHSGKNLWSAALDHTCKPPLVITGGADGRAICFCLFGAMSFRIETPPEAMSENSPELTSSLEGNNGRVKLSSKKMSKVDELKSYCWISKARMLVTTADGSIKIGDIPQISSLEETPDTSEPLPKLEFSWSHVGKHAGIAGYSQVAALPGYGAVIGGSSGEIFLYRDEDNSCRTLLSLKRKIGHIVAINMSSGTAQSQYGIFVSCLGSPKVTLIQLDQLTLSPTSFRKMILALPFSSFVSALHIPWTPLVLLGTREGSLWCFSILEPGEAEIEHLWQVARLHRDAITTIHLLPGTEKDTFSPHILTCGRDGRAYVHRLDSFSTRFPVIFRVHEIHPPLGPCIEGTSFDEATNDLLLWGFLGNSFMVWNVTREKKVMQVDCGGAHRKWAYMPENNGCGGGTLIWTRASQSYWSLTKGASHRVLQLGNHGRLINVIAVRGIGFSRKLVFATGSEDTNIQLHVLKSHCTDISSKSWTSTLSKHTTGVQRLQWSSCGRFLFSGGSRDELFAWKVSDVPYFETGIACFATCPPITESTELRVMGFDMKRAENEGHFTVWAVYSDSSLRVWKFDPSLPTEHRFSLKSTVTYSNRCLTHIKNFDVCSKKYLLTSSTDGCLALWDGVEILPDTTETAGHIGPQMLKAHRIHQNSIKTFVFLKLSPICMLIATAGDDNALGLTLLMFESEDGEHTSIVFNSLIIPHAHAASITDVVWSNKPQIKRNGRVGNVLVSISNDQVLGLWEIEYAGGGTEGLKVRKVRKQKSEIADACCIELLADHGGEGERVVIVGNGMEVWNIERLCDLEAGN